MGKRLFIIVLVILVLVGVALPPVLGIVYEKQVRNQFEDAPPNPYVHVELSDHQRGLYSSRGTVRLSLSEEYLEQIDGMIATRGADEPVTAEQQAEVDKMLEFLGARTQMDYTVRHGPVTFSNGVKIGLATVHTVFKPTAGKLAELQETLGVPYLARIDAVVRFDRSSDFQMAVPPMSGSTDDARFVFTGLTAQGNYDHGDRHLRATGSGGALVVEADDGRVSVENITFESDMTMLTDYLWLGTGHFDVGSIGVTAAQETMTLRDFGMGADTHLNDAGDKLFMSLNYGLVDFDGGDANLGDLQIGMHIREIDLEAAKDYMRLSQQAALTSPEEMQEVLAQFQDVAERILRGSPAIEIGPIRFTWNGERFLANLSFEFDGNALPAGVSLDAIETNPGLLLGGISGDGQIETTEVIAGLVAASIVRNQMAAGIPEDAEVSGAALDAAAEAQAEDVVAGLIEQGLIERADGQLRTNLEYANGELRVNGTLIPL